MLDKFLTGENVKVNGEIAGHRHIFRTLIRGVIVSVFILSVVDCGFQGSLNVSATGDFAIYFHISGG